MIIGKTVFFMWLIWYCYTYGPPPLIYNFFMKFYLIVDKAIIKYNALIYPDYWDPISDSSSDSTDIVTEIVDTVEPYKPPPKYEDKYLDIIRKLNKEWQLTEYEIEEKRIYYEDFYQTSIKNIQTEIIDLQQQINIHKKKLEDDADGLIYIEKCNDGCQDVIEQSTLEEINEYRRDQIKQLTENVDLLTYKINSCEGLDEIKLDAKN